MGPVRKPNVIRLTFGSSYMAGWPKRQQTRYTMSGSPRRGLSLPTTWLDPLELTAADIFAETRKSVGLDQIELARATSPGRAIKSGRSVSRFESGSRRIPGQLAVALAYMAQGMVTQAAGVDLPTHVCSPNASGTTWVVRLRKPRYFGIIGATARTPDAATRPDGLVLSVVLWLDAPEPERLRLLAADAPLY